MCCMDWIGSDIVEKTANVVPAWVCVGRDIYWGWLVGQSDIFGYTSYAGYGALREGVYNRIESCWITYPLY